MSNFVVETLRLVDATVKPYTITAWSNVSAANATSLRLMLILYVALFGVFVWYGALRLTMGQVSNICLQPILCLFWPLVGARLQR